jgi:hypothetical protein
MDRRLLQLQALQQYFDDNAEVARTFQHEYKALTWRAVEETKRHDPYGLEHALGDKGVAAAAVIVAGLLGLAMVVSVGHWVVRAGAAMQPDAVARRALELRRQSAEQRIAEFGEETRAAIQEAAERRRRDASR